MKKALIAASLSAALLLGGCAGMGEYFSNPKNDLQLAETAFSVALNLYENVCNANTNAPFCTAENMQQALMLEQAVIAAIHVAQSVLGPDGSVQVNSSAFQADVQNVVTAVQKFSDFVNSLQADKTKAMALKAVR